MKKEVSIRKATLKDLHAINNLNNQFCNHLTNKYPARKEIINLKLSKKKLIELIKQDLRSKIKGYFLIEKNGTPIGFSRFWIKKPPVWIKFKKEADITDLFINSKYRKKGYGKELLNHTINFLNKKDCKLFTLGVHPKNPAQKLYLRVGFKQNYIGMYKIIK